jgi:hypothetical protein
MEPRAALGNVDKVAVAHLNTGSKFDLRQTVEAAWRAWSGLSKTSRSEPSPHYAAR